ncbi:MAG: cell division protein FtsA [Myxococcales bacterium]|nr:cell division protein FtsA [Myxococcales bacterium]
MASSDRIIAGLDLGTSNIKCVIGVQRAEGSVDIVGTGSHPAVGIKNGTVCSAEDVVRSIRAAVEEAEMMAGCDIAEVFVSISGRHLDSFNSNGVVRVAAEQVTDEDVLRVIDVAKAHKLPADHRVLHVVPQEFVLDHQTGVQRPVGMSGVRLEVQAHVLVGNGKCTDALEACCQQAGLRVVDIVLAPLAQAEALLTSSGREMGVALLDIGGDTTDLAVFHRGAVVHTALLPIGGEHVTADIKDCLNVPTAEAEHLKQAHGCALAALVDPDATVELPGVGGRRARTIKRSLLCEVIEARVEEILKLVHQELEHQLYLDLLRGGLVLTGGMANLDGMTELAEQVMDMPAVRGAPKDLHGLVEVVQNPRYSTGTGLVQYGLRQKNQHWFSTHGTHRPKRGWSRFLPFVGR